MLYTSPVPFYLITWSLHILRIAPQFPFSPSLTSDNHKLIFFLWTWFFFLVGFCLFLDSYISEVIWYSLSLCLISLNIRSSKSMYVVANGRILVFYGWIFHIVYFTTSLSTDLSMNTEAVSISWLWWILVLCTWGCRWKGYTNISE